MKKMIVLALLILSPLVHADELRAQSAETFIGGSFGLTFGYIDSVEKFSQGLIDAGASYARTEQALVAAGAGLSLGSWFDKNLGWELGFNYLGSVEGNVESSLTAVTPVEYSYSASALHLALLAGAPVGSGKLYGKIGVHATKTISEWTSTPLGTSSSGETPSTGLLIGIGYQRFLGEHWSTRVGLDLYNGVKFVDVWDGVEERDNLSKIALDILYSF